MTDHPHMTEIDIPPERFTRWLEAAKILGEAGTGLASELASIRHQPTRHMLGRAAKAARYAESVTTGEHQLIANAVATEIENDAVIQ